MFVGRKETVIITGCTLSTQIFVRFVVAVHHETNTHMYCTVLAVWMERGKGQ